MGSVPTARRQSAQRTRSVVASSYEPHVVVCDCDLITPALLDEWAAAPILREVPLHRGEPDATSREDLPPLELVGVAGVLYLPALERDQVHALLAGAASATRCRAADRMAASSASAVDLRTLSWARPGASAAKRSIGRPGRRRE